MVVDFIKMKNAKKTLIVLAILILISSFVFAHTQEEIVEAKKIIDANISCSNLSEEQLNILGDYFMEQMHPGEVHELMHEMMGGENSSLVKQMHINMARMMYCNGGYEERITEGRMMGACMMGRMMDMDNIYNYKQNSYQSIFYITMALLAISLVLLIAIIMLVIIKAKK